MTAETPAAKARRIAAARAARPRVDSQGRPTGKPTTYTYDERGLLVEAVTAEADE
jgi:YD repeat-containing protein